MWGTRLFPFLGAVVTAVLLDAIWLGVVAGGFYANHIGPDMDAEAMVESVLWIRWGALAVAYAMIGLIVIEVCLPMTKHVHGDGESLLNFEVRAEQLLGAVGPMRNRRVGRAVQRNRPVGCVTSYRHNFFRGAGVGFLVYGLYNSTNLSFLEQWDLEVTIVDTLWGSFLFGACTVVASSIWSSLECLSGCQQHNNTNAAGLPEIGKNDTLIISENGQGQVEEVLIDETGNVVTEDANGTLILDDVNGDVVMQDENGQDVIISKNEVELVDETTGAKTDIITQPGDNRRPAADTTFADVIEAQSRSLHNRRSAPKLRRVTARRISPRKPVYRR